MRRCVQACSFGQKLELVLDQRLTWRLMAPALMQTLLSIDRPLNYLKKLVLLVADFGVHSEFPKRIVLQEPVHEDEHHQTMSSCICLLLWLLWIVLEAVSVASSSVWDAQLTDLHSHQWLILASVYLHLHECCQQFQPWKSPKAGVISV